ncbi:MAG: HutD family protein [Alphaproteobacteria bacterium]|nr:HutD family protein [Alphaproteobacteria bacterium]
MIRILRAADRRRIPWKNGGGEAEDIVGMPEDAGWDELDWRVGRAWITASGPFSFFAGVDRTFTVVEGTGVELSPAGRPPARLDGASPPYAFPGDVATACRLLDGPAVAFNVMARRDRWSHAVERRPVAGEVELDAGGGILVVYVQGGGVRLSPRRPRALLGPADAFMFGPATPRATIDALPRTVLLVVRLVATAA